MVWYGMVCGLVWYSVVRCGMVCCGVFRAGGGVAGLSVSFFNGRIRLDVFRIRIGFLGRTRFRI